MNQYIQWAAKLLYSHCIYTICMYIYIYIRITIFLQKWHKRRQNYA